ncbi:exported protein of unknown function [Nitrososphaera viennensis EN76]|uniref:Uncharacterized protein n=1 Tax=Nitrososphaera viennensis EN76 TaxID=926571 RepID=A0A060HL78_9ARCH|nr:exported protein of unknown function [Nitrososphaera viennensis EN76]
MDFNLYFLRIQAVYFLLGMVAALILLVPSLANATNYDTYQSMKSNFDQAGVQGSLTVYTPSISGSASPWNHRDYMVYVNFYSTDSSMGAGWYAQIGSSSVEKYNLVYRVTPTIGVNHDLWTQLSAGTTFTAKVEQQTSSTSYCWKATTISNSNSYCFPTGSHPAGSVGNAARSTHPQDSSNNLPGWFDSLKVGKWVSGSMQFNDYFSSSSNPYYKCYSSNGFILNYVYSYTGSSSKIDTVATSPGLSSPYNTDSCTVDDPVQAPINYGGNG